MKPRRNLKMESTGALVHILLLYLELVHLVHLELLVGPYS